jgi:flagella basal body P-ring formation protein FlgA
MDRPIVANMMRWPLFPALLLCLFAVLTAASAQESIAPSAEPDKTVAVRVQQFVLAELTHSQPKLRAEISVGEIEARLHLAACERTELFLRPGTRLWGRSFVGYRCLQRPNWSVSIPVMVRLFGPALIAAQPLPAFQPIPASAVRVAETELTRESGGLVKDPEELADKVCTRPIEQGQAIPLNALRTLPAVNQGEPVKVSGVGSGFSITTEGTAMATAAPGELVRVRMESGRTIAGIARKGRVVEVSF